MKNLSKWMVLIAVTFAFSSVYGQKSLSTASPKSDADTSYFMKILDGLANVTGTSPNGDYAVFFSGVGGGILWHRPSNSFTAISKNEDAESNAVTDDGTVIGMYLNPEVLGVGDGYPSLVPAYWTMADSTWHYLELPANHIAPDYTNGGTARAVSADGRRIVGNIFTADSPLKSKPCSWYDGKFEKTYDLPWPESTMGGVFTCISGDGKLLGGWAEKVVNGIQLAYRSPILYSLEENKYIEITEVARSLGEIVAINNDGTRAVGREELPIMWKKGIVGLKNIVTSIPNTDYGYGSAISNNGVSAGKYGTTDFPDPLAFIYFENIDKAFNLYEYVEKVYGIDPGFIPYMQATAMSNDGTVIYVNDLAGNPGVIVMRGKKNLTPPENIRVVVEDDSTINIKWDKPIEIESTLTGFELLRNGSKIASLGASTFSYTDSKLENGKYKYSIIALYDNLTSEPSLSEEVEINKGKYSPKDITASVQYNKIINVSWPIPSPYLIEEPKSKKSEDRLFTTPDTNKLLQFSNIMNLSSMVESSVAVDEQHIYTASWTSKLIYVYDKRGEFIKNIYPECPFIQELTTDGNHLYATVANDTVYKLDKTNGKRVGHIHIPGGIGINHISYIPYLDNNKGGFECGSAFRGIYISKEGTLLKEGIFYNACVGTAVIDTLLFVSEQMGKSGKQAKLNLYNAKTGAFIETVFDFEKVEELQSASFAAGGISIGTHESGATCLFYTLQGQPHNYMYIFELSPMPKLIGYNIYKDGAKVNNEPYLYRNYQEIQNTPGTFKYQVEAIFENGVSEKTKEASVSIVERGECIAPGSLKAESMFNYINLSWTPIENQDLVGYVIYKDGKRVNESLLSSQAYRFSDKVDVMDKEYKYEVLAFYNSGCEAISSITATTNSSGKPMPVSFLQGKSEQDPNKAAKVELSWKNPLYDAPLALRYGYGDAVDAIGLNEEGTFAAAIGWAPNELSMYGDYDVVGAEVFIFDRPKAIDLLIIENDKVIVDQPIAPSSLRTKDFNYIELKAPYNLKPETEFAIGFRVLNRAGSQVIGTDFGPATVYFSDLISIDSNLSVIDTNTYWQSTGSGNWAIAAALSKTREISTNSVDNKNVNTESTYGITSSAKKHGKIINKNLLAKNKLSTKAVSKADAPILLGYKISKEDVSLTPNVIKENKYEDLNVETGKSYFYDVFSVWQNGDEIPSGISVDTDVSNEELNKESIYVFPNPVSNKLFIRSIAEIEKIELFDNQGSRILNKENTNTIDVSQINSGIYFLKLYTNSGVSVRKVQIVH